MTYTESEWPIASDNKKHDERVALLRIIPYEMTGKENGESVDSGKGLSVNISSGGMLMIMDKAPDLEQVLRILVPTPTSSAATPTLAEVRWTRKVPVGKPNGPGTYFVGLKFIF